MRSPFGWVLLPLCGPRRSRWTLLRYGFCLATVGRAIPPLAGGVVEAADTALAIFTLGPALALAAGHRRAGRRAIAVASITARTNLAPDTAATTQIGSMTLRNRDLPPPGARPAEGPTATLPSLDRLCRYWSGRRLGWLPHQFGRVFAAFSWRLETLYQSGGRKAPGAGAGHGRRRGREPEPRATHGLLEPDQMPTCLFRRICAETGRR